MMCQSCEHHECLMDKIPISIIDTIIDSCEPYMSFFLQNQQSRLEAFKKEKELIKKTFVDALENIFEKIEEVAIECSPHTFYSKIMDQVYNIKSEFELDEHDIHKKTSLIKILRKITRLPFCDEFSNINVFDGLQKSVDSLKIKTKNMQKEMKKMNSRMTSNKSFYQIKDDSFFDCVGQISDLKTMTTDSIKIIKNPLFSNPKNMGSLQSSYKIFMERKARKVQKQTNFINTNPTNVFTSNMFTRGGIPSFFKNNRQNLVSSPFQKNNNEVQIVLKKNTKEPELLKIEKNVLKCFKDLTKIKKFSRSYESVLKYVQSKNDLKNEKELHSFLHISKDFIIETKGFSNNQSQFEKKQLKINNYFGEKYLNIVSGFEDGIIHYNTVLLQNDELSLFMSNDEKYILIKYNLMGYFIYGIEDKFDNNCKVKVLKDFPSIFKEINKSSKVKFITIENKLKLIYISTTGDFNLLDLESKQRTKLIEKDVIDFDWIDQSEIIVIKKGFKNIIFDVEKMIIRNSESIDFQFISKLVENIILKKNDFKGNKIYSNSF